MTTALFAAHVGDDYIDRQIPLLYLFTALVYVLKGAGMFSLDYLIYEKLNKND